MTALLTICTILGGVVALSAIVSAFTLRGRRMWRRVRARLARRPVPPRTNVHIEPDRQFCYWSQSPPPSGNEGMHVGFELHCVATNLTPGYELRLVDVELRGVEGAEVWHAINSADPEFGMVTGAVLPADVPVEMMLIVVVERGALPDGPHSARMIVRDHLGNRYRTPKVSFRDAKMGAGLAPPAASAD